MKCKLLGSMFVLGIVLCSISQATLVQWSSSAGGNDHFYEVVSVPSGINWYQANNLAMSSGGYLATITSAAENSFVYGLLDFDIHFIGEHNWGPWLGGYQPEGSAEPYGGWSWVTGEPFVYSNWTSENPDDYDGIEDYLHFFRGPQWNDIALNGAWNSIPLEAYVVEYIPEPASAVILGLGSFFLVLRRRRRQA